LSKSKFCEKLDRGFNRNQETDKNSQYFSSEDVQVEEHNEHEEQGEQDSIRMDTKKPTKEKDNLRKQKRKEFLKINKQKKRARIIIRNLSFQVYNC
jgi:hypothetical protein